MYASIIQKLIWQVPIVAAEAQAALAAGQAVVIGLQSTGEAAADAMQLEPGQACGFVSTTRELLTRFVAQHFPVRHEPGPNEAAGKHQPALLLAGPDGKAVSTDTMRIQHAICEHMDRILLHQKKIWLHVQPSLHGTCPSQQCNNPSSCD